jgi:NAD(P) transhydrogenase subunit alpha
MSDDYNTRAAALYATTVPETDIVITKPLIPGRPAPRLITAEMVAAMKPGSVIVDMAAATGGNVEGTVPGEVVVTANGVTIVGYTDLAGRFPAQASQLYATNLVNLMKLMTPGQDGELVLDFDDVVQCSITVVRDGQSTWPPPPVQVSAAPTAAAPKTASTTVHAPSQKLASTRTKPAVVGVAALGLFLLIAASPAALQIHLIVFALAIVIGYYVIGNVHHALHTALMSVTNAISGIIVVGALLLIGHDNSTITALAFAATLLATINVFGGFVVTRRMLAMFSRS